MTYLIAFIGSRLSAAQVDISSAYNIVRTNGPQAGTVVKDGLEQDFIIITQPDQLRGLRLSSYEFLPSANLSWREVVEFTQIANSRLREAKP